MSIKSLIKNNAIYQAYIRPLLLAYKHKREKAMNDETYFLKRHKKVFGYKADFHNPHTFNEKIIHRILFDRNPIYTILSDKLKARIYISHILKDMADSSCARGVVC
ncbi:hypothetical protein [uncultured Helicobacter sp.]|uniref:hypothetical protein n=1 Tax=uncultured Helicobacter sp. TaxID=175537 RepID=UPI002605705F|nr:hypothetical protein [uncultured Helicobacter sp.]